MKKNSLILYVSAFGLLLAGCASFDSEPTAEPPAQKPIQDTTPSKYEPTQTLTTAKNNQKWLSDDTPAGFVPETYPENSLNIHNTYWDNFTGIMEKGKTYQYSNKGFDRALRFKVIQVWDDNAVLIARPKFVDNRLQVVCEEAIFLLISKRNYADGSTLKDGSYECVGTQTYETVKKAQKTVYVLVEKTESSAKEEK